MADGDTPGSPAGDAANPQQRPGGEPAAPPPQAYAGAYPPYPSYSPYPPYPGAPAGMPSGAPGAMPGQPPPTAPYGYPPYPFPSGPAPAQYPYPYPYPYAVPQPARKSNRALWITLSIAGAALLVVCVSCSVLFAVSIGRAANSFNQLLGPEIAASTFCVDVQEQRYSAAYDQLSRNLQSQMTRDQFESAASARDQASGPVTDCTPDTNNQPGDTSGPPTLVHVTVTRTSGSGGTSIYPGDLTLVREDGVWKIDAIDSSLGLI